MIDGKEGASGSSWKGPPVLPVRDDSMEQVTWEQCVLKDDKNLPDSKWGQWMGKAFREQLGQSCGGIETPLLLSFILPQQVWCPIGVSPFVAEGGDLPGSHAPVPALLPSTPQEGLQANSLLTPLHQLSPLTPWVGTMQHLCPGLKVLRQATDCRILVAPAWRAHPQVTGYLSSPAVALTLRAGLDLRLPGASLPVAPGILGPPAHHQAHCDAIQVLVGLCCLPFMFTSSRELFPHPQAGVWLETDRRHCWPSREVMAISGCCCFNLHSFLFS